MPTHKKKKKIKKKIRATNKKKVSRKPKKVQPKKVGKKRGRKKKSPIVTISDLTVLIPPEPPKKPKKETNFYFNDATQEAIVEFQKEPDIEQKKKIFTEKIRPSFAKLIENIIFVYSFHSLGEVEQLKNDCMSFLFENLYKFDASKGFKAFGYFNVIAKNWFIQKVKVRKKKNISDVSLDKELITEMEKISDDSFVAHYEDDVLRSEFLELLKEEIKKWRGKFDKDQEKKVLEAAILLINNPDLITIYNKKAIYLYLREICGLNTKQIVTNLTKLKKKYNLFKKKYLAGEI